ncbi:unnamed protein product [Auanema sp. JU1783]|nr:unnamed protein product [Auanema sp. JU1783]
MTSLFRGALNLIQGENTGGNSSGSHPLVGQDVDVGGVRLRIKSLLAEGGFAVVFSAQDQQGNWFALKRQLANDKEAIQTVINEINYLKELGTNHPNIIRFVQAAQSKTQTGGAEFLLLTELCNGGCVGELLKTTRFKPKQVLKIFYSACKAVQSMHCREKPITHRDIKVENLLIDSQGNIKLCDFGSSTREILFPNDDWTSIQRTRLIEDMQRNTTPMYRAPEIQDEYMNLPVGPQQDVWALGCILFYLSYGVHPFEDSAKLRIVNAKYAIPPNDQEFTMFVPLIQSCLKIDPRDRPTIKDLVERVEALATAMGVTPSGAVEGIVNSSSAQTTHVNPFVGNPAPSRPPPPRQDGNDVSQQASAMFGAIKGQGLSLFKNIKDKSAAVVQTVQSTYGGKGPSVTWLTSRIILAPQPESIPEALATQAEDSLRTFSAEQGRPYIVVNISQRRLKCEFPTRPIEQLFQFPSSCLPPTVNSLLKICREMMQFLRQNPNGFALIYGLEVHCTLLSATFLLYSRVFTNPLKAVEMVTKKRGNVTLPPSYHRALDIVGRVINTPKNVLNTNVHNFPIRLNTLYMEPIPLFNRLHTGCRPFAEIFSGGAKLWSTYREYEQLRPFDVSDGNSVEIDLGDIPVGDDVTVAVYHARWSKIQNKMQQILMFSIGFHANFWDIKEHMVKAHMGDLDIHGEDTRSIPENIRIVLGLKIDNHDRGFNQGIEPPAFLTYDADTIDPIHVVENAEELVNIQDAFDSKQNNAAPPRPAPPVQNQKQKENPQPAVTNDFFNTLDWQAPSSNSSEQKRNLASDDLFGSSSTVQPAATSNHMDSGFGSKTVDTAEAYERMYGIRVGKEEEDDDADKYKFDYEKETPILGAPSSKPKPPTAEFDLLDLGAKPSTTVLNTQPAPVVDDPFGDFFSAPSTTTLNAKAPEQDLFGDWTNSTTDTTQPMHRNVSAPSFNQNSAPAIDPFADFLNAPLSSSQPGSKQGSASNSGTSTPKPVRPNYSRSAFETINNVGGVKPKVTADAFGDLLSSQGFTSTAAKNASRTIGDLKRADEIRDMDPVEIKIRDWIKGKEKNIRALLGSLNDVLWDDADKWQQPNMGELLSAAQVKKWYRKACLVVHPDKQTGTAQEELAKAVFTQLNEAWTAFEQSGSPSL